MNEQTQMDLLAVAKKAMTIISVKRIDPDFVFEIRDVIRRAEQEVKSGRGIGTDQVEG